MYIRTPVYMYRCSHHPPRLLRPSLIRPGGHEHLGRPVPVLPTGMLLVYGYILYDVLMHIWCLYYLNACVYCLCVFLFIYVGTYCTYFIQWEGHVLVGTTDHKCPPSNPRPEPLETEILWLINEASKYLNPDLKLQRKHVLSAWSGIRPLAIDPHQLGTGSGGGGTAAASRDHIISYNPKSGVVFVAGGKWTTYRYDIYILILYILYIFSLLYTTVIYCILHTVYYTLHVYIHTTL